MIPANSSKHCNLVRQGYQRGDCSVNINNKQIPACQAALREKNTKLERLIHSIHHSRPEFYLSIYQSGCNLSCQKCHSWEFTQYANGEWLTVEEILKEVKQYEKGVNVREPKERVTAYHAYDLEGVNPKRGIVAFTGGDLTCRPDFYRRTTEMIKDETDLSVLIETNGYGLTDENLDQLKEVDSFWLDIKAYHPEIHKKLTGVSNERILKLPEKILKGGHTLEVLSLYIPGWVEKDQIAEIGKIVLKVDEEIPFTILAYFPAYKLTNRPPTSEELETAYHELKDMGLINVRMGNLQVCDTHKLWG